MPETIKRETINYLACEKCGVVFPDRDNPETCPICQADADSFISYEEKLARAGRD